MKKVCLLFVCILLFVLCLSGVSFSYNIPPTTTEFLTLDEYQDKLSNIKQKMLLGLKKAVDLPSDKFHLKQSLVEKCMFTMNRVDWSCDIILLFAMTYITKSHLHYRFSYEKLEHIRNAIKSNIDVIIEFYEIYSTKGLGLDKRILLIVDDQLDLSRSSLITLDKTIKLMKKMSKK